MAVSLLLTSLLIIALAIVSLLIGLYLLSTDPPKDDEKFVGIGAEKANYDELNESEGE